AWLWSEQPAKGDRALRHRQPYHTPWPSMPRARVRAGDLRGARLGFFRGVGDAAATAGRRGWRYRVEHSPMEVSPMGRPPSRVSTGPTWFGPLHAVFPAARPS